MPTRAEAQEEPARAWTELLRTWVRPDGRVRYGEWHESPDARARLEAVVASFAEVEWSAWTPTRRLALLIDAYNASVVRAVLARWPVDNVLRVDGFFDGETHRIAGRTLTLNELEHEWIRPEWREPRIHFVLNCASLGCPPLLRESLQSARDVDAVMESATRTFIAATTVVDAGQVRVSRLFEWFAEDFEPAGGVRPFVAARLDATLAERVLDEANALGFHEYDWTINAG